jgi:hypothetical protein
MTELARVRDAVAALYERNRQRGHAAWCGRDYDFVCPSHETYPFQWLWDSAFHAVALRHLDVGRAQAELSSLLANQQDDGFVAHVTFWQRERYEALLSTYSISYRTPHLSDCIQPPVLGEALALVADAGADEGFVDEHLPKVCAFFDFLHSSRDPDGDGLIATLQPDESGLDHTPKYDAYLGVDEVSDAGLTAAWERAASPYGAVERDPARMFDVATFVVEDVLVNTIWLLGLDALARLLRARGDDARASVMEQRRARGMRSLLDKCWDDDAGLFFDVAGTDERKLRVSTVSSLLPLALPDLDESIARRLLAHVGDDTDYGLRYPVPSVSAREATFSARPIGKLVWRGPTWINTNWYVARGCRAHGREDLAARIEDASVELTLREGFFEYYDPFTGQGAGARDFSWSGLVLDMLAARE